MKEQTKLISCIMANYNTDISMLRAAIESILNQTYLNFEFIIIDDCSTDDSVKIIEEYAEKDKRIIVKKNEVNRGLTVSLNNALKYVRGDYIARMDSDDISLPNRFECQIKYMESNRNVDVCGSYARFFGESNNYSFTPYCKSEEAKSQLLFSAYLLHPTVMMRKEFLIEHHLKYDEKFKCSQDFDLWTRCAQVGNVTTIKEILLLYRVHSKQISSEKREVQRLCAEEICKRQLLSLGLSPFENEMNCHMVLCGLKDFDINHMGEIMSWAKKLDEANKIKNVYHKRSFRNVLYNRIFNLVLKSNFSFSKKMGVLISGKRLITLQNLYSIIKRMYYYTKFSFKSDEIEKYI